MKQQLILSLLAGLITLSAYAQDTRPIIKFIVPYSPGGITDELARDIVKSLSDKLGINAIIEYKPGATGLTGANFVSKSNPDGRTFLFAWSTVATAGQSSPVPYNAMEQLTPVSLVIKSPMTLVVNSELPVDSIDDFIQLAKKTPGKLNYGTSGVGSIAHLVVEKAQQQGKFQLVHIPYKGHSGMWQDFLGGRLDAVIDSPAGVANYASLKKVKILGFTSDSRLEFMPQIPTFAESSLKDFRGGAGFLIFAPEQTSRQTINQISESVSAIVNSDSFKSKYNVKGLPSIGSTPKQAEEFLVGEIEKWKSLSNLARQ